MINKLFKYLLCSFIILFLCSCNNKEINEYEIFSYPYNFTFFGFDETEDIHLKASTVSSLDKLINDKESAIFLIASPTCMSCKNASYFINNVAKEHNLTIYVIDHYSNEYPVYDCENYDIMINVLKDTLRLDDDGNSQFYAPELIIINNGEIVDYIIGSIVEDGFNDDYAQYKFKETLSKSIFYIE